MSGTYEDDGDDGEHHDCVALFCRLLYLSMRGFGFVSRGACFHQVGKLLFQVEEVVEL